MNERFQRYGLLRLFVVFVVVAVGYGTRWAIRDTAAVGPFVGLAASTALVASAASWWARRFGAGPWFAAANLVWDVFFASALCYLTGASYSLGQLVFLAAIAGGAWLGGTPAAVGTAAAASVGLAAALLADGSLPGEREAQIVFFSEAMFRVFGFFLLALGSGYLTESLRRERQSSALLGAAHETVLERVKAGVVTVDAAGRILGLNPAGEQLLGRVAGRPAAEVLPRYASRTAGAWEEAFADGRRWVCSAGPLPDGGEVLVIEDVSELARMREERQRAERLLGAGRFAAGLAHEIRNPLSSISGCLQMLREERPSTLLNLALGEADRLNRLVDDFLSVSRPPALERRPADVADVAREVVHTFAQDGRYRDLVRAEWRGAAAPAVVDPDRVRQALWNLVMNSAQAMPDGGRIEVVVTDRVGDGQGATGVEIVVRDDGLGIPPEDRSRVFDPLFTRRAGGTGLGLAVVDHVVRAHGGRVTLESPDEGGTTFRLWLPKEVPHAG